MSRGESARAVELCRQVLRQLPNSGAAYQVLGMALEADGDADGAMFAYGQAVQLQPELGGSWAYLGQLCDDRQWWDEATRYYRQALRLQPEWGALRENLARVLEEGGDLAGAAELYRQGVDRKPQDAVSRYNLGVVLARQNRPDEAIECYEGAIALRAGYLRAYSNLGCLWGGREEPERAIELYERGIAGGSDSATNEDRSALYNNLGQAWMTLGKQQERQRTRARAKAIECYEQAIALQDDRVLAHYNLGKVWQQQRQYDRAIACFDRVLALDGEHLGAYSDAGMVLMARGRLEEAMVYFHRALRYEREFVEAYCRLHRPLNRSLHPQEGETALDLAQEACVRFLQGLLQQPDAPEVLEYLADTYTHLGKVLWEYGGFDRAGDYFQRALQIRDRISVYLALGRCLLRQKRVDAALAVYHLALGKCEEVGDRVAVWRALGQLHEGRGDWQRASDYYERVLGGLETDTRVLPELLVSEEASNNEPATLPDRIYATTWDWVATTTVEGCDYQQVSGEHSAVQPPFSPASSESSGDCGGLTCGMCLRRLCEAFSPVHLGLGVYRCEPPEVLPVDVPPQFVVTIPEGRAWIVPQRNDWLVCKAIAIVTPDGGLLGDVSRDFPWYLPGCQNRDIASHQIFEVEGLPPEEYIDGTVAVLSSLSGHIYYHWTIDLLPRIEILRQGGIDLDAIDGFLVNNLRHRFQREMLQQLGIPEAKIIESDRHPHLRAKCLIVPSFPGHLDWIPPSTIEFLRREFLPLAKQYGKSPERIYISRSNAKHRRVLNEEAVVELLSSFGFVSVCLEEVSLGEQVSLFAGAKIIISAHGSAWTNAVFCSPETTIIELFSPNYIRPDYWMVSSYLRLKHFYIICDSLSCYPLRQLMYQNPLTEDIWVNLDSLKKAMDNLIQSRIIRR